MFHHERGREALDPRQGGERVVFQCGVRGQIRGDYAQEIVRVAEQPLRLEDVRDACHGFLEGEQGVAILLAHGDEDKRLEREADGSGVDDGTVAGDDLGTFELAQAPMARRQAEPDSGAQIGDGEPPVFLQFGKDLPVDRVHACNSSTRTAVLSNSWKHIPARSQ